MILKSLESLPRIDGTFYKTKSTSSDVATSNASVPPQPRSPASPLLPRLLSNVSSDPFQVTETTGRTIRWRSSDVKMYDVIIDIKREIGLSFEKIKAVGLNWKNYIYFIYKYTMRDCWTKLFVLLELSLIFLPLYLFVLFFLLISRLN